MSSLGTTIEEIQAVMRAITGIGAAPNYPTDTPGYMPAIVCYPASGTHQQNTAEDFRSLHNVVVQFHYPRTAEGLAAAMEESIKYAERIPDALFGMIKDNAFSLADTFESISYQFVSDQWADQQTLGFEFTIQNLKIRTVIS